MITFDQAQAVRVAIDRQYRETVSFVGAEVSEARAGEYSVVVRFAGHAPADLPTIVDGVRIKVIVLSAA